jgi:hypothetical protein
MKPDYSRQEIKEKTSWSSFCNLHQGEEGSRGRGNEKGAENENEKGWGPCERKGGKEKGGRW